MIIFIKNKKLLAGLGYMIGLYLLGVSTVVACDCKPQTIKDKYRGWDYIFVGFLTSATQTFAMTTYYEDPRYHIKIHENLIDDLISLPERKYLTHQTINEPKHIEALFNIEVVFKGERNKIPKVIKFSPGSCGFPAIINAPYLIFTDDSGSTISCSSHDIDSYVYDRDPDVQSLRKIVAKIQKNGKGKELGK